MLASASFLALFVMACSSDTSSLAGADGKGGGGTRNRDDDAGACATAACSGDGGASDGAPRTDGATSPPGKGSGGTGGAIGASVPLPGCTGCTVHVPSGYTTSQPAPLLVALHGDEGPGAGVPSVIGLWSGAADKHGYLVLALACSADIGCADGNWSGWLANGGYQISQTNIDFINAQAAKVESLYDVDTKREFLTGYSGGAYVMGYFAQAQASRYAAVAFVAGGMPAWTGTGHACPARKIPGYFLGGDGDFRTSGQMSDTANSFKTCGEEITLDVVMGADHGATIASLGTGRADTILSWFATRALP